MNNETNNNGISCPNFGYPAPHLRDEEDYPCPCERLSDCKKEAARRRRKQKEKEAVMREIRKRLEKRRVRQ